MRYLLVIFAAFVLAACSKAPVTHGETQAVTPAHVPAPKPQKPAPDSVVEFLLTAAATDFYTHRPPDAIDFRHVRIGHTVSPTGEEQYRLCGEFLPALEGNNGEWTPFATVKTSGYEQWIGAMAAGFCQGPSVKWNSDGDLSATLLSRLDLLR